ncbi:MAG: protein-tyrosine phosphatase family protein, partial [Promethearchaeota archaeon]
KYRARDWPVVVHCEGGCGRTGTFLAAYLISQGHSAEAAIKEIRRKRPCSIETKGQEEILYHFAKTQGHP